MRDKKEGALGAAGQASAEYLLTFAAVFIALAGASLLFSNQINRYLSFLFSWIVLPF